MPTNTSFKVQCPSCEAQVPVRDPALVGKKIDCPKCKYRFVVEDPNDEGFDEERGPRKGAKGKAKKKAGNNNVLILGSVLGVVAVILLGVGAYFLFFNNDSPSKPVASNPPPINKTNLPAAENTAAATPGAATTTPHDGSNPAAPANSNPNTNVADASLPAGLPTNIPNNNITNLLPNNAQAVYSIHMEKFRACTLGQQAFESRRVGFRPETFKQKLGIDVAEIDKFVRESLEGNWSFNVFHTIRPVTLDELKPAASDWKRRQEPDPRPRILQARIQRPARSPGDNLALGSGSAGRRGGAGGGAGMRGNNPENTPRRPKVGPLTVLLVDRTTFVDRYARDDGGIPSDGGQWEMKSIPAPGGPAGGAPGEGDAGASGTPPPPTLQPARPGRRAVAAVRRPAATGGLPPMHPGRRRSAVHAQRTTWLLRRAVPQIDDGCLEGDGKGVIAALAARSNRTEICPIARNDSLCAEHLEFNGMNVSRRRLNRLRRAEIQGSADLDRFRATDAKALEEQSRIFSPRPALAVGLYLGGLQIDVTGAFRRRSAAAAAPVRRWRHCGPGGGPDPFVRCRGPPGPADGFQRRPRVEPRAPIRVSSMAVMASASVTAISSRSPPPSI